MGHGVQPHHIGSAEGARAGAAHFFAGEVVHHIKRQAEVLHLFHGRQHAGNADPVGDEVGRVLGPHHTLAQGAGDEGFELVQDLRLRGGCVDQLHQGHVARRVEEVDAAETRLDGIGQCLAQACDRQARGVAGHDGAFGNERCDLVVQVGLPVHALGDRLDDQVAAFEQIHVLFVVGGLDQRCVLGHTQRRGLEFLQAVNGFGDDGVFAARQYGCAFLGCVRQVKQDDRHLDVDQVRGDLRAHHACAQHGDFFHIETGHGFSWTIGPGPRSGCGQKKRWSRALRVFCRPLSG